MKKILMLSLLCVMMLMSSITASAKSSSTGSKKEQELERILEKNDDLKIKMISESEMPEGMDVIKVDSDVTASENVFTCDIVYDINYTYLMNSGTHTKKNHKR